MPTTAREHPEAEILGSSAGGSKTTYFNSFLTRCEDKIGTEGYPLSLAPPSMVDEDERTALERQCSWRRHRLSEPARGPFAQTCDAHSANVSQNL